LIRQCYISEKPETSPGTRGKNLQLRNSIQALALEHGPFSCYGDFDKKIGKQYSTENDKLKKYTDKKESLIFHIYKEIQNEAVAKSYMTNGLLMGKYLRISSYKLGSPLAHGPTTTCFSLNTATG
jgi:hypothetical protein